MTSNFSSFATIFLALVIFLLLIFGGVAYSADLASQERALRIIADFADRLCKPPPEKGGETDLELSGSAKAELNEVIEKVAALGIEGAAKYRDRKYQGVLQKDLANLLQDAARCRIEVFRDLKDRLLPREKIETLAEQMVRECSLGRNVTVEVEAYNTVTFIKGNERRVFDASSKEIPNILRFLEEDGAKSRASGKTQECMERYISRIFSVVPGYQERIYVLGFPYLKVNVSSKDIARLLDEDRGRHRRRSDEYPQKDSLPIQQQNREILALNEELLRTIKEQEAKIEDQDQSIQQQNREIVALRERLQAMVPPQDPGLDPTAIPRSGCIVAIRNPLVALKSEPDVFSRDLIKIRPGNYNVLNFTVTSRGGLREEGWFQIEAEGRTGWIRDNILTIEAKTRSCP